MILPFSVPVFPFLVLRVGTFPVLLDPAIQTDGLLREFQPGHGGLRRAQVPAVASARSVLVERCPELDHRGVVHLVQIIRLRFFRLGGVLRHILQPLDDGRA